LRFNQIVNISAIFKKNLEYDLTVLGMESKPICVYCRLHSVARDGDNRFEHGHDHQYFFLNRYLYLLLKNKYCCTAINLVYLELFSRGNSQNVKCSLI